MVDHIIRINQILLFGVLFNSMKYAYPSYRGKRVFISKTKPQRLNYMHFPLKRNKINSARFMKPLDSNMILYMTFSTLRFLSTSIILSLEKSKKSEVDKCLSLVLRVKLYTAFVSSINSFCQLNLKRMCFRFFIVYRGLFTSKPKRFFY